MPFDDFYDKDLQTGQLAYYDDLKKKWYILQKSHPDSQYFQRVYIPKDRVIRVTPFRRNDKCAMD